MEIKEEDRMHLLGIVDSITEIQGYAGAADWKDYSQREDMQMAISSQFQQIGSAAALLSDEFKDKYRDIDWDVLKGLQYANYDQELELDYHPHWHIIKDDLPIFLEQIEDIISEFERVETLEDDKTLSGTPDEKYDIDTDNEEYLNRRSGDQWEDDEWESVEINEDDDDLLNRVKVVEDEVFVDDVPTRPLGDEEIEDDSFIDQRFEDVDLMEGSSLDDYLEEEENKQ